MGRSPAVLFGLLALGSGASASLVALPPIERSETGYRLEARIGVAASAGIAWEVLTDYEELPRFSSTVSRSQVVERAGDRVTVSQEILLVGGKARLLLETRQTPRSEIEFIDRLGEDFRIYAGAWRLAERHGETLLVFRLVVEPKRGRMGWLGRLRLRRRVRRQLEDLRQEMLRRKARYSGSARTGRSAPPPTGTP